ncbi:hypothetical protein PsAD2_01144 [Pseudovibrio axinellae]|uniref:Uncharacterized protein n=1 Tax=Pseudovibrio axinellae TaxID=989403 RepID=A0A166A616_9HYPH|nr:hypothetical protein [Pseudovibrio axinellae]KZL20658.1 hypothetical protein PsAD2_01144 [Pseudovibrio axinellae]SER26582.1 hypothetical protein SAMN05421798_107233 [Pseudovibrio axinellae]
MTIYRSVFRNNTDEKQHWMFLNKANRYVSWLSAKSEYETGPFDFRRNVSVNLLVNGGLFGTSLRYNSLRDSWSLWPLTSDFSLQVEKRTLVVECALTSHYQSGANVESLALFFEQMSSPNQ